MKAFTSFLVLSFVALTLSLSADYTYNADSVVLSTDSPTITINNADIKTTVEFAPGVCKYPSPSTTTNSVFSLTNGGSLTAFTSLNQLVQTCGFQKVASDIEIGNDKFTSFGSQVTVTRVRGSTTTVVEQDILVLYPQAFVTDASVKVARDTLGTDFSIVVDSVTYAPNVWTIGVTTSTPAPYKISLTSAAEFDGFSLGSITEGSSSEDGTNLEQKWTFTVTNDISDDTCKAFDMTIVEFFTATPMCIEDDCSTDGPVPDSFKIDLSVKTSGSCAVQQTVATFTTPSVTTTAFENSYDSAATKDIFGTSQTIYFDTEFTDLPNNMEISGSISQLCVVTATDKVNCARDITAMVTLQTAIDINHIGFTASASQLKSANSDVAGSEDIYVRISYDLDFADASRKRSALVRTAIHKIVVGDMESSTGTSLFVPLLMIALFALIA